MTIQETISLVERRLRRNFFLSFLMLVTFFVSYQVLMAVFLALVSLKLAKIFLALGVLAIFVSLFYILKKKPSFRASACSMLDNYLNAKERITSFDELIALSSSESQVQSLAVSNLIKKQVEPLISMEKVDAVGKFQFSKREKWLLFTLPLIWAIVWFFCGYYGILEEKIVNPQQVQVLEKLLQTADALPDALKAGLEDLIKSLKENELNDEEVQAALNNAEQELNKAQGQSENLESADKSALSGENEKGQENSDMNKSAISQVTATALPTNTPTATPTPLSKDDQNQKDQEKSQGQSKEKEKESSEAQKDKEKNADEKKAGEDNDTDVQNSKSTSGKEQEKSKESKEGDGQGEGQNSAGKGDNKGEQSEGKESQEKGSSGKQESQAQSDQKNGEKGQQQKSDAKSDRGEKQKDSSQKSGKEDLKKAEQALSQVKKDIKEQKENQKDDKGDQGQGQGKQGERQDGKGDKPDEKGQNQGNEPNQGKDQGKNDKGEKGEKQGESGKSQPGEKKESQDKDPEKGDGQDNGQQSENKDQKTPKEGKNDSADQSKKDGKRGTSGSTSEEDHEDKSSKDEKSDLKMDSQNQMLPRESKVTEQELEGKGGPGLGENKAFKNVEVQPGTEQYDTRYLEENGKVTKNDKESRAKTNLSDVRLAKPENQIEQSRQPIPLEYKDLMR